MRCSLSPIRSCMLLMAAAVCGTTATAQTVLTVSSWVPPSHTISESQKEWCELLQTKSGGKVKCNILPRGVAAPPGTYDAVRNGLADVSFIVHTYTPGRFVTTQIGEQPFLGESAAATSVAFQRIYAKTPAMAEEHKGVKVLSVFTHGPGVVFNTKRPITKLDEFSGLKFRIGGGGMLSDIARVLGMNVTSKPATESYELMSTGVLDGTVLTTESIDSMKLDKVVRYVTTFPGGLYNSTFAFIMNPGAYERLPPEGKKAVDELSGEPAAQMFGRGFDKADRRGAAAIQAAGLQVTKADAQFVAAVREKTTPLIDAWVTAAEARGAKDARQLLKEFRADIDRLDK